MTRLHVVWDWNGTLLDDLHLVVEAVSRSIERFGLGPIDEDDYRDHYTRPVRSFYDSLFARPVTDMEWADLNKTFHELYYAGVDRAALTGDAREALVRAESLGWGQSLLSMSTEVHLIPTVKAHGIFEYFSLVAGLRDQTGDVKATYLERHLAVQGIHPESVVVVGDTPDDHDAARAVGAGVVLYDGGSHHRNVLESRGVPVVDTLLEAVDLASCGVRT